MSDTSSLTHAEIVEAVFAGLSVRTCYGYRTKGCGRLYIDGYRTEAGYQHGSLCPKCTIVAMKEKGPTYFLQMGYASADGSYVNDLVIGRRWMATVITKLSKLAKMTVHRCSTCNAVHIG
jgi:hypothetical protein